MFHRMKVIKSDDIGSVNWSPTVQHVERMKRRRWRRVRSTIMLAVFVAVLIVLSLIAGSFVHLGV